MDTKVLARSPDLGFSVKHGRGTQGRGSRKYMDKNCRRCGWVTSPFAVSSEQPTSQSLGARKSRKETECFRRVFSEMPGSLHLHAGAKSKSGNEVGIRVTERAPVGVSETTCPLTLCLGPLEWRKSRDNIWDRDPCIEQQVLEPIKEGTVNQVKGGCGVDTDFRASLLREVSTGRTPNSAPALIPFCDSSLASSLLSLPFHLFNRLPYTRPPTWYATPVLTPSRSVVPAAPTGPFQGTDHRRPLIGTGLMRSLSASRRLLILLRLDQGRGLPPSFGSNEGPRLRTAELGESSLWWSQCTERKIVVASSQLNHELTEFALTG